jgi:hypothetical protein
VCVCVSVCVCLCVCLCVCVHVRSLACARAPLLTGVDVGKYACVRACVRVLGFCAKC